MISKPNQAAIFYGMKLSIFMNFRFFASTQVCHTVYWRPISILHALQLFAFVLKGLVDIVQLTLWLTQESSHWSTYTKRVHCIHSTQRNRGCQNNIFLLTKPEANARPSFAENLCGVRPQLPTYIPTLQPCVNCLHLHQSECLLHDHIVIEFIMYIISSLCTTDVIHGLKIFLPPKT